MFFLYFDEGSVKLLLDSQPTYEDDTIDYFGDLEGACNVDDFSLGSPPNTRTSNAGAKRLTRQASDISEASLQISSTPEAESYFRKKTELYQDKALRGELDISVSDPSSSEDEHQHEQSLQVLPLEDIHEEEIEIFSLNEDPVLTVRPDTHPLASSSFENLYDRQYQSLLEEGAVSAASNLNRSSFHATFNVPERVSSFENLYQDQEELHDHHLQFQGSYKKALE